MSEAPGATPRTWPSGLSAAAMPAQCVPWPDDVSLSLYGPWSTGITRSPAAVSLSMILTLCVTRLARSGCVASMPLSTMATPRPLPLLPMAWPSLARVGVSERWLIDAGHARAEGAERVELRGARLDAADRGDAVNAAVDVERRGGEAGEP